MKTPELSRVPDSLFLVHDLVTPEAAQASGERWTTGSAEVLTHVQQGEVRVTVLCPRKPISHVGLRWRTSFPDQMLFLGDHWERGYGDLQWRSMQPDRLMPWYFAGHDLKTGESFSAGVKTQANAICFWIADAEGITLWLDMRNGSLPSEPGDRAIAAATVVSTSSRAGESPFAMLKRFCATMCPSPRLASVPVCGNNNWYYAYGRDFDQHQVMRDALLLAELAGDHKNRPYCVIDAGWSEGGGCPGGPWREGRADTFPDMPRLAADMKAAGVRPGIWMRPTALSKVDDPKRLRPGPHPAAEKPLDLSLPETLELIREDVARIRSWGYELIKHDFSTYDMFGRWGFEFNGGQFTAPGWSCADRSLNNAEIILGAYRAVRDGAGDALLIGCNTIGHLGAGLFEIQRIGDDTSGKNWERTRKMGINTLAFRLPQHNTFFAADADCVAHTEKTPWELDRQFLDLVARSGTALFVSVDPRTISHTVKQAMHSAMQLALSGGEADFQPLDWLWTTCPQHYRSAKGEYQYNWTQETGAWPIPTPV